MLQESGALTAPPALAHRPRPTLTVTRGDSARFVAGGRILRTPPRPVFGMQIMHGRAAAEVQ